MVYLVSTDDYDDPTDNFTDTDPGASRVIGFGMGLLLVALLLAGFWLVGGRE